MIRWIHRRQLCNFNSSNNDLPIYDPIIKSFNCYRHDEHEVDSIEPGIVVPPFVCKFCPKSGYGNIAAIADEDGVVRLLDSRLAEKSVMRAFPAHNNAIFDLAWLNDSSKLVTASGDQSAVVWDIEKHVSIATMKGHSCSLKSIAVSKHNNSIMATGARDGNVMVWDLRCHQRENGSYAPVKMIHCAHTDPAVLKPPKSKRRRRLSETKPARDSQQSVTSVVFQDENFLLTSGATDGSIKMWDLRKSYHGTARKPLREYAYAGDSMRQHGYSCLTLDPTCSHLYASCTDDIIYEYNLMSSSLNPVSTYRGHQNATFYVKSCLSADGQYLLSGSSDNNAYIWKVGSECPVAKLTGHQGEVTSVSWCPEDFRKIMTCADDNTFRLWRSDASISPADNPEQSIVGTSEVVTMEIKDTVTKQIKCFGSSQRDIHTNNNTNSIEGVTANLPTGTANLFSVVKHKQKKILKDISLKTCWKRQEKESKQIVENSIKNNLDNATETNEENKTENTVLKPILAIQRISTNDASKVNKENSPVCFDSHKEQSSESNSDNTNQFDSPKRVKNQNIVRMYLSPTANLPNRVIDLEKREKELPQVWNNTKSSESRKVKANWLKELSKKLSSDSADVMAASELAKGSPKRSSNLKKRDLPSPSTYKRKVRSPDRDDICFSPSNSRPSSPVSSQPTTPKMRKISAYFQPVSLA
ncbi:denticleless protein homolog [Antedon mediterranea]|uniref:denticleless protein homolog n=1 Tax=Antedon mediterranea TaxID=105859 RepID=UPI003AF96F43